MPITTAAAVTVGATAARFLSKPFNDLYAGAKGSTKSIIGKWIIAGQRDAIEQRISDVEMVQTISSHNLVKLTDFYYPSKILKANGSRSADEIKCLNDIATEGNILIRGTVGQGKSIFMRYLCISELRRGRKIPVFVELREIDSEINLELLLIQKLEFLGLSEINQDTLSYLFDQGSFIFFLDGFDEIKREYALNVQKKLAGLIKKFPTTRWIVSSRPGSLGGHVSAMTSFRPVTLQSLDSTDFDPFFKALAVPETLREKMKQAISNSPAQIQQVLTTPLMLTLLNLTFGTSTFIPATLHEFYEAMFHVLVSRHDETKTGFIRQKVTGLSNGELQTVFEHFCYLSKDFGNSLSDEQFAECAKKSAKLTNMELTAEGLKSDLTETLCLMLRDGLKTAFIHKSVQEFFAAYFIKKLGHEQQVIKIYEMLRTSKFLGWTQELKFLEEIDKYRYIEHFRLPETNNFLLRTGYRKNSAVQITKTNFRRFISSLDLIISVGATHLGQRILAVNLMNASSSTMEFVSKNADCPLLYYLTEDDLPTFFPKEDSMRFEKYISLNAQQFEHLRKKLIEFCKKLEREAIKLERLLQTRQKSFAEILGL